MWPEKRIGWWTAEGAVAQHSLHKVVQMCACASVHEMVFMAHEMYIACMYNVYSTIYILLFYNLEAFVNSLKLNLF